MKFLSIEKLSPHRYKTPEGYLICTDAIIARTGKQQYKKNELFVDSEDDETMIDVDRPTEEVFSEQTIASGENKPLVDEHPEEDVTVENHRDLSMGYMRDLHKGVDEGKEVLMANIVVTDPTVISEIESGDKTELSCGYDCQILKDSNGNYYQSKIRINHLALCERGRAGNARIQDSIKEDYKIGDIIKTKYGEEIEIKNIGKDIDGEPSYWLVSKKTGDKIGWKSKEFLKKLLNDSVKDAVFEFTVHYKNGDIKKEKVEGKDYNSALKSLLNRSDIDSVTDYNDSVKDSKVQDNSFKKQSIKDAKSDITIRYKEQGSNAWDEYTFKDLNEFRNYLFALGIGTYYAWIMWIKKNGERVYQGPERFSKIEKELESLLKDSVKDSVKDDKPFTYSQVYQELKIDTQNFTQKDGEFTYSYEEEANHAIKALKRSYNVDMYFVNDRTSPTGELYHVKFSKTKQFDSIKDSITLDELEKEIYNLPYIAYSVVSGDKILIDSYWRTTSRQTEKDRMDLMRYLNAKVGKDNYDLRYEKLQWRDNNKECSIRFSLKLKDSITDSIKDSKVECLVSNSGTAQRICSKYRCQLSMIDYDYNKKGYKVLLDGSTGSIIDSLRELDESGLLIEYPKQYEKYFDSINDDFKKDVKDILKKKLQGIDLQNHKFEEVYKEVIKLYNKQQNMTLDECIEKVVNNYKNNLNDSIKDTNIKDWSMKYLGHTIEEVFFNYDDDGHYIVDGNRDKRYCFNSLEEAKKYIRSLRKTDSIKDEKIKEFEYLGVKYWFDTKDNLWHSSKGEIYSGKLEPGDIKIMVDKYYHFYDSKDSKEEKISKIHKVLTIFKKVKDSQLDDEKRTKAVIEAFSSIGFNLKKQKDYNMRDYNGTYIDRHLYFEHKVSNKENTPEIREEIGKIQKDFKTMLVKLDNNKVVTVGSFGYGYENGKVVGNVSFVLDKKTKDSVNDNKVKDYEPRYVIYAKGTWDNYRALFYRHNGPAKYCTEAQAEKFTEEEANRIINYRGGKHIWLKKEV